jgi:hypothetical protein
MRAIITRPPRDVMNFMISADPDNPRFQQALIAWRAQRYEIEGAVEMPGCDLVGEQAAEECFDVTNNPARQDEREAVYGRGRSVCVGDVVIIQDSGGAFMCCSSGWHRIE